MFDVLRLVDAATAATVVCICECPNECVLLSHWLPFHRYPLLPDAHKTSDSICHFTRARTHTDNQVDNMN